MNIEEDGIPNTLSIDRFTLSRAQEQVTDKPYATTEISPPGYENYSNREVMEDEKKTTKDETIVPREYAVNDIVRRADNPQGRKYLVRGYDHCLGNETLHPLTTYSRLYQAILESSKNQKPTPKLQFRARDSYWVVENLLYPGGNKFDNEVFTEDINV